MQYKEYVINGTNGGSRTSIDVDGDGDICIADFHAYNVAYIPMSQIDELINIVQEIKQTARIKMDDSVYQQKVTAPDGTKLKALREQPTQDSVCAGCYFEEKMCADLREEHPTFTCAGKKREDKISIIWVKDETPSQVSPNKSQIYKAPFYHKDGFVFNANHRSKYETNYF